jgi:ADP-dependent phosphofructokinase/glucokinase
LNTILHLEIASTQDLAIRRAIIEEIAPLADSIGINEREAIDILEVIGKEKLASRCRRHTTSDNLFQALVALKEKTGVPRIQLHMFGLYLILQDRNFQIAPIDELNGMMTAATIAAAKAGTGTIDNLLWAQGRDVSDVGLIEAESLAVAAGQNDLVKTGIGRYRHWDLIIAPTILIEKPVTLVGMGDTISSLSLVAARP